jgi:Protein of unknown function (DUF3005)
MRSSAAATPNAVRHERVGTLSRSFDGALTTTEFNTMQNAEGNPTQAQQNEMAAKSPAKTPAAGSASPDEKTQAREFGSTKDATSAEAVAAKEPAPLPPVEREASVQPTGDPVERANERIVPLDVAAMAATDDTVDTDGKGLEAMRDASPWQDNVIYSDATLDNSLPVRPEGLVGIDPRPGHTMPIIATRSGWRVERRGAVEVKAPGRARGETVFTLERVSDGDSADS